MKNNLLRGMGIVIFVIMALALRINGFPQVQEKEETITGVVEVQE